jgi:RHS repeat-associated protein
LYNAGSELNATSQWYETFFRGYDPTLGRFLQVDPMATKYSSLTPYNYAFNNPVLWNDPLGDAPLNSWDEVYNTINNLLNSPYGGFWNKTQGYAEFTSLAAEMSYASAMYQRDFGSGGGGGMIAPIYGDGRVEKKFSRSSQTDEDFWIKDVIGYKFGPATQGGWFDDKQGEFFFDHWRNGNGQELFLNDSEWSTYMKSNDYLATVSIASHLWGLGIKHSGRITGSFHAETGKSDWKSGHGMLNGSNADVGNLQYSGYAYVNDNGSVSFLLKFTWNDIMDPNPQYFGDRVGSALFPGTPYIIHISWTDLITITPK